MGKEVPEGLVLEGRPSCHSLGCPYLPSHGRHWAA